MNASYKVIIETKPRKEFLHHVVVDLRGDEPFPGFEQWMEQVDPLVGWKGPIVTSSETHDLILNAVGTGELTAALSWERLFTELRTAPATIGRELLRRVLYQSTVCMNPIRVVVFRDR